MGLKVWRQRKPISVYRAVQRLMEVREEYRQKAKAEGKEDSSIPPPFTLATAKQHVREARGITKS